MVLVAGAFLFAMAVPYLMGMKKNTTRVKGDPFLVIFILGLTFLALSPADIENRFLVSSFLWSFASFVLFKIYIWPAFRVTRENEWKKTENLNFEYEIQIVVIFLFIVFVITGIVN